MPHDDDPNQAGIRAAINRSADDPPTPENDPNWREHLLMGDKDKPRPVFTNALVALRSAPQWAGVIGFDEFAYRAVMRKKAPWMTSAVRDEPWSDYFDSLTCEWLQRHDIFVKPHEVTRAVQVVAREHPFHPVRDYLQACPCDGAPRLDTSAITYLGAADTPYSRAVVARWMISAVARIMEPGCKADCMLILEGPQGKLKSTALETLGTPWYTDELAELGTKDASMQLAGKWIFEMSELDSIIRVRGNTDRIKAFMSRKTDRYRPAYGAHVVELPRQCVFAGSSNKDHDHFGDDTGNRRFWPLTCGTIDIEGLRDVRHLLWGEAVQRYLALAPWWLDTEELQAAASEEQDARLTSDPWFEPIAGWLHRMGKSDTSIAEILENAIARRLPEQTKSDEIRVGLCLRKLGWQGYRLGSKQRRYRLNPYSPTLEHWS